MRLASVTIENFRSITKAHKVPISDTTVLVGPNNEGKSNILRALVLAMRVLGRAQYVHARRRIPLRGMYDWEKDFPIHLQEKRPDGESVVILDFSLTADDVAEFKEAIGSNLKDNLPLKVALSDRSCSITVHKKGRGSVTLSRKSAEIARFVAARIDFEHIPAIRTAKAAQRVVEELVERALTRLDEDAEYQECLNRIAELQQPILNELSSSMHETLAKFLPAVKSVSVEISREQRYRAMRQSCKITVDDGTPTLLERKGDGVQSLAALAIMRHATDSTARGRHLVVAIEEPESHLHPDAIHELRAVLSGIEEQHQVVLTTHNPLFVDRAVPANNVVVHKRKAQSANGIEEIRRILGVRASDNLRQAELVLAVEGEDDRIALTALLSYYSEELRSAFKNKSLAIEVTGGASKLAFKLAGLRDALCLYHALVDSDAAGRAGAEKAIAEGLIRDADVNYVMCRGKPEAELEDIYDRDAYADVISAQYRVDIRTASQFRGNKKWSARMRASFEVSGKTWGDRVKKDVKLLVAKTVAKRPADAVSEHHRQTLDALVAALEQRLDELRTARG